MQSNVCQNSKHEPVLKKEVTSCPSSLIQIGTGVPQYRFLDTAQSRASRSQLPNLFSFTKSGTLSKTRELCWPHTQNDTSKSVPLPQQKVTQASLYLYLNKKWHKQVCTSTSTKSDTSKSVPQPQQKVTQASLYLYLNKKWYKQVCNSSSHKRQKFSIAWLCSKNSK